jgi:hypothetical protein
MAKTLMQSVAKQLQKKPALRMTPARIGCPDSFRESLHAREQGFREKKDHVSCGTQENCCGAESTLGKGQGGQEVKLRFRPDEDETAVDVPASSR